MKMNDNNNNNNNNKTVVSMLYTVKYNRLYFLNVCMKRKEKMFFFLV